MESALSPREIQSRIRAGESLAEVATAAGLPEDKIAAFAGPVLAERDHMVVLAKAALVRRRGDTGTHRSLSYVIDERMHARRLDPDLLTWNAHRLPDRTWRLVAVLRQGDLVREAWFDYDSRGKFNVAANADARWLIGEESRIHAPDEENTVDLNDELALVRATAEEPQPGAAPTPLRRKGKQPLVLDVSEDYHPAELTEIDGLYDIVGPDQTQKDVLYEMLSGISEDSVRIYAGLAEPVTEPAESSKQTPPVKPATSRTPASTKPVTTSRPVAPTTADAPSQPEQGALIEAVPEKPKRRGRASVPAWDDILFGTPPKKR